MSHYNTSPNTVTCNTVLNSFDVAGKWSMATVLFDASAAVGLDVVSFNTVTRTHSDITVHRVPCVFAISAVASKLPRCAS